jgi:hypothetical protein
MEEDNQDEIVSIQNEMREQIDKLTFENKQQSTKMQTDHSRVVSRLEKEIKDL